jgi:Zn-dependent M16 (insulinase) family peptidase
MADEGEDVTKFIIGAIGEYDTLLTPRVRVALAQRDYLAGFSSADEEATMQEMLAVTTEDLRRGAELIRKITEKGRITIVGGRDQLNSMKNPPKRVIEL